MSITSDVLAAVPFLAPIGAGVALLWILGRDRGDDEHTVADYRPAVEVHLTADTEPFVVAVREVRRRLRRVAGDVLPPTPAGADAGSPLYAETLFRTWHPDPPAVVAARMLREIADDERAKDGIGPDGHAWQLDGSCWSDCPGCAYDLTGAFPVVAVA